MSTIPFFTPDAATVATVRAGLDKRQAAEALRTLRGFIGRSQLAAIGDAMRGEEKQFFFDKVSELAQRVRTMPKTYETDGQGEQAIAQLHYFKGGMDWYIVERDMEAEQLQAFGLADLGYGGEVGYISLVEILAAGAELDLYFAPRSLASLREVAP